MSKATIDQLRARVEALGHRLVTCKMEGLADTPDHTALYVIDFQANELVIRDDDLPGSGLREVEHWLAEREQKRRQEGSAKAVCVVSLDFRDVAFDVGRSDIRATYAWRPSSGVRPNRAPPGDDDGDEEDSVHFEFVGSREALLSLGIVTEEAMQKLWTGPRNKKRKPVAYKTRLDRDGDKVSFDWSYRKGLIKMHIKKPLDRALRVPGFSIAPLLERFRRPPATSP
jgi:hypothetical protein